MSNTTAELSAHASPTQIVLLLVAVFVIGCACITVVSNLLRSGHHDLDHRPPQYKPRKRT